MRIRKLTAEERPPMALLLLADPSQEAVQNYLNHGTCYIIDADDQIIGVSVIQALSCETIELKNLAVLPSFQGQGLGQKLVNDAIKTAKAQGFKRMEVGTGNSSLGPLRLYDKLGFKQYAVDNDFFIRNYTEPIFENGIQCRDLICLTQEL